MLHTYTVREPHSTREIAKLILVLNNICLGARSRQNCRYTKSPLDITPFKGNLGVPTGQRKFDLGGVWTYNLQIKSSDALPTELQGQ